MLSGSVEEELGAEAMREGAGDFLEKGNLARLIPAIARELRQVEVRRARERAEEMLRLLEMAVETMDVGVTITDVEGRILFANRAEAEMHGYPREELVGKDVRIFSPSQLWKPMSIERVKEIQSWQRESVNLDREGRTLPVQLISNVVRDPAGRPVGIVTVSEDIRERKELEERLRHTAYHDDLTGLANRALFLH